MNLPNALTILRIFFVPLLVAALVQENVGIHIGGILVTNEWLSLAIFLAAAGTDLLDGYLARRWKQVTTIGTLLDPIADKLLISAALISLVQIRTLPAWMAILIIGREFAVSGLRSIAAAEGYTIRASDLGKTKMFSQVVAISVMLLSVRHPSLTRPSIYLMWGVVFFSITSAFSYFGKFWHKVDESVKNRRRQELLALERRRQRVMRHQRGRGASAAGGAEPESAGGEAGLAGTIWKPPEVN
jgi:CDP-diacylglycerol--glycerol-3-phosphate 3-phosphatidyltransferase